MPTVDEQLRGIDVERMIRERTPRPQDPHADYVGLALDLSRDLGICPSEEWIQRHDIVLPHHFASNLHSTSTSVGGSGIEARVEEVEADIAGYVQGKGISGVIFRSLIGKWDLTRIIESRMETAPSGVVAGTVEYKYMRTKNVANVNDENVDISLLNLKECSVHEVGRFSLRSGASFDISREDIYCLNDADDTIDIYFSNKQLSKGNIFLNLKFHSSDLTQSDSSIIMTNCIHNCKPNNQKDFEKFINENIVEKGNCIPGWQAVGVHNCGQDVYYASYVIRFIGSNVMEIEIKYTVKGPNKDYDAVTTLVRRRN